MNVIQKLDKSIYNIMSKQSTNRYLYIPTISVITFILLNAVCINHLRNLTHQLSN